MIRTRLEINRERTVKLRIGYRKIKSTRVKWESEGRFRTSKDEALVIEITDSRLNNEERAALSKYLQKKFNWVWHQKNHKVKK